LMHTSVWEAFLKNVKEEWREFILYVSRDIKL
jgi:hypothetical protein